MSAELYSGTLRRLRHEFHGRGLARVMLAWAVIFSLMAVIPKIESIGVEWTVGSLVWLLRAAQVTFGVAGSTFSSGSALVSIVGECTSLLPCALLFGGMLGARAPWWYKACGIAFGIPLLWMFNLIRIAVLLWVLDKAPAIFDFTHLVLWQTMTTVFMGWILWSWLGWRPRGCVE